MSKWGFDRSAMIARLFGVRGGKRVERRWTLIADEGNDPEIPALPVPLLVTRILAGQEVVGARGVGLSPDLTDYAPSFDGLPITNLIEDGAAPASLHERLMGPTFQTLPPTLRAMHQTRRDATVEGEAQVTGGSNAMARILAAALGFPASGQHKLRVDFAERDGMKRWTRTFGHRSFNSELSASNGWLVERFGPIRFRFDLLVDHTGLSMRMRGWSVFAVPLPMILSPRTTAREWEAGGLFHFDVSIGLPLIGPIVRYRGWLATPEGCSAQPLP